MSTWWKKLPFYHFYTLREGTAVPVVWFSIELTFGLFVLENDLEAQAGFVDFLQSPAIMIISLTTLAAILLHTKTWFELAPKAASIIVKNEKMGPEPITKSLWAVTVVAIAVTLSTALYW